MRWSRTGASGVTMKYGAEPAGRPSRNGAWRPPGAIRWLLINVMRTKTACAVGLKLDQRANLFGTRTIGYSSLNIEHRASNIDSASGDGT